MKLSNSAELRTARRHAWTAAGVALLLYALLRAIFGPLPQWPSYHDFADTRTLGPIPRAGDVLTNLAILAAGIWVATLRGRVVLVPDERPAYRLFACAAILTAFGSAWYHWEPGNARLVMDRLPMALLMTGGVALVLGDRGSPALARAALWPLGALAVGSVLLWGFSESFGRGDLWLYLVVRIGATLGTLALLTRRPRYGAGVLLLAAVAIDGLETASEHSDWQIWRASGELISGHNLKHLFAGSAIACVGVWLLRRRPLEAARRTPG